MSQKGKLEKILPLIIPFSIATLVIVIGVFTFFSEDDLFFKLLTFFLIFPGLVILLYTIREFKIRREGKVIIKYDERSDLNRLKASDRVFRFFFVSLMFLFVLNSINIISETAFVAIIGPLVAVGIALHYLSYYWYEHQG